MDWRSISLRMVNAGVDYDTHFPPGYVAGGHHGSEDAALFPQLSAHYPALRPTIDKLRQDHELIASLLTQFDRAIRSDAPPAAPSLRLDGLAAIMESHFRYEERQLLGPLSALELDADLHTVLGPL